MDNLQALLMVMSFVFGSIFGSFLNVVILRLPEEKTLQGRSKCFKCGHILSAFDLIPLLSYVFLLGKCRYCKARISPRYFVIEFLTGVLFALSFLLINPVSIAGLILLLKYFLVISALIVVFVIDLEHFLILDSVVFSSFSAAVVLNLVLDLVNHKTILSLHSNFIGGLAAAVFAALPFFLVWYFSAGKWMGFGDVKLALLLGVFLGFPNIFVGLMLAILSGGFLSIFLLTLTDKTLKSRLPFGTFLSFGSILTLFYGEKLLNWYLSILGF